MALDLTGKRVAVIGMARSGSGAATLVTRLGGRALVSDKKPAEALSAAAGELQKAGIEIETGSHDRVLKEAFDLVVLSPGVVPSAELETSWQARGIPVWSELQLAAKACDSSWIGVTGSNGKTTTVHLIAAMLRAAGYDAVMAGNVGAAWSGMLPAPQSRVFVVEVSSFQMETSPDIRPHVGVLLNLFENHLDRHGTMQVYSELKARLFRNQSANDFAVINGDDPRVAAIAETLPGRVVRFGRSTAFDFCATDERLLYRGESIIELKDFPLTGRHNALNAAAAAAAAFAYGASLEAIGAALKTAQAVEHRIEFVANVNGVAWYNDSKSTNMVATMTALDSFAANVILLFGGRPKKESFAPLATRFGRPLKHLIAFGEAAIKVTSEVAAHPALETVAGLEAAVTRARELARQGDTVLLSPGCTSFDEFNNFEERGRVFKALVKSA